MEVSNGSQNQTGRIALGDNAGLVAFGAELRRDHHQVSNRASSARYRQRSTKYCGALTKLDHIRFQILAADPYQIGGVFAGCRLSAWEIIKANPVLIPATR